jgi:hypothetical protein
VPEKLNDVRDPPQLDSLWDETTFVVILPPVAVQTLCATLRDRAKAWANSLRGLIPLDSTLPVAVPLVEFEKGIEKLLEEAMLVYSKIGAFVEVPQEEALIEDDPKSFRTTSNESVSSYLFLRESREPDELLDYAAKVFR